jgi:hypothetical protein
MKLVRPQQFGVWLRRANHKRIRTKTAEWYSRQPNKSSNLVRRVVDLVHWDVVLEWYTIDHLTARYGLPNEEAVTSALFECGYPRLYAASRAKPLRYERQGVFYLGPTQQRQRVNPLMKYLSTYKVRFTDF